MTAPLSTFRIREIKPEKKDFDRVNNFRNSGARHDDNVPFVSKAEPQANAITDPEKLVRRAKAVVAVWGIRPIEGTRTGKHGSYQLSVNMWKPFMRRLAELGFTIDQIYDIMMYHHDDPIEVLGLKDLFDF
jgi:hypothetical protein